MADRSSPRLDDAGGDPAEVSLHDLTAPGGGRTSGPWAGTAGARRLLPVLVIALLIAGVVAYAGVGARPTRETVLGQPAPVLPESPSATTPILTDAEGEALTDAAAPSMSTSVGIAVPTTAQRKPSPRPAAGDVVGPATTTAPRALATPPSSCVPGPSVSGPGIWVAGRRAALRQVTADAVDAYAWAPDGDRIAWISGGSLRWATARGEAVASSLTTRWRLIPRVGWSDKSDAVIVAGQHPDGRVGIWHLGISEEPRLLRETKSMPLDLSVGRSIKRAAVDNGDARYRHVIAFVADGQVQWMSSEGSVPQVVAEGAFDTVVYDRLGENIAFGGPGGIGVSLYPNQPAKMIAPGGTARPAMWSYLYDRILIRDGAITWTLTPDGSQRIDLGRAPRGALFAPYGRVSYVAEEGPTATNIIQANLDGTGRRVVASRAAHPAASGNGPVSWVEEDTNVVCMVGDSQSTDPHTLATFDGVQPHLPPTWTLPQETTPTTPEPLLALALR